jgi:hypothetical protein
MRQMLPGGPRLSVRLLAFVFAVIPEIALVIIGNP